MQHDQLYRRGQDYAKRSDIPDDARGFIGLMTIRPPVGLYFDESMQHSDDICATAGEFLRAGLLPMPFDAITISAPNFYEKANAVYEDGTDIERAFNIWAVEENLDQETKRTLLVPFRITDKGPEPSSWVIILDSTNGSFKMMDFYKGLGTYIDEERYVLSGQTFIYGFLQCLLMLNHPVYNKQEVKTDEKQNRKREAKGKTRLNPYIYIRMKKEIREGLTDGSGKPRKPHWRRGHLRNLGDGRIIPVQPCLVNWEGDPTEIAKKTYVYREEKNA